MSRWKPDYDPSHLYFVTTTAIHHVHLFKRDVIRRLLPWRAGHEETQPGREADPQGPQGAGRRLPRLGCHHLLGRSHRRCAEERGSVDPVLLSLDRQIQAKGGDLAIPSERHGTIE